MEPAWVCSGGVLLTWSDGGDVVGCKQRCLDHEECHFLAYRNDISRCKLYGQVDETKCTRESGSGLDVHAIWRKSEALPYLTPVDGCHTLGSRDACLASYDTKAYAQNSPCHWCCGDACIEGGEAKCESEAFLLLNPWTYTGYSEDGLGMQNTCRTPSSTPSLGQDADDGDEPAPPLTTSPASSEDQGAWRSPATAAPPARAPAPRPKDITLSARGSVFSSGVGQIALWCMAFALLIVVIAVSMWRRRGKAAPRTVRRNVPRNANKPGAQEPGESVAPTGVPVKAWGPSAESTHESGLP